MDTSFFAFKTKNFKTLFLHDLYLMVQSKCLCTLFYFTIQTIMHYFALKSLKNIYIQYCYLNYMKNFKNIQLKVKYLFQHTLHNF